MGQDKLRNIVLELSERKHGLNNNRVKRLLHLHKRIDTLSAKRTTVNG